MTNPILKPHVRDLNKQNQKQQEEQNKGGLFGAFVTLAAAGMAVMAGANHALHSVANTTTKSTTPNLGVQPSIKTPQIDTRAIRGGAKRLGKSALNNADDVAEILENNQENEKEKEPTIAKRQSEYDY